MDYEDRFRQHLEALAEQAQQTHALSRFYRIVGALPNLHSALEGTVGKTERCQKNPSKGPIFLSRDL